MENRTREGSLPIPLNHSSKLFAMTRGGALVEILGDAALFVDRGDAGALAEALGRVVDDDGLRCQLVKRGYERARLYTWEAAAAGLARLYHDASSLA